MADARLSPLHQPLAAKCTQQMAAQPAHRAQPWYHAGAAFGLAWALGVCLRREGAAGRASPAGGRAVGGHPGHYCDPLRASYRAGPPRRPGAAVEARGRIVEGHALRNGHRVHLFRVHVPDAPDMQFEGAPGKLGDHRLGRRDEEDGDQAHASDEPQGGGAARALPTRQGRGPAGAAPCWR